LEGGGKTIRAGEAEARCSERGQDLRTKNGKWRQPVAVSRFSRFGCSGGRGHQDGVKLLGNEVKYLGLGRSGGRRRPGMQGGLGTLSRLVRRESRRSRGRGRGPRYSQGLGAREVVGGPAEEANAHRDDSLNPLPLRAWVNLPNTYSKLEYFKSS
jgi:hypothetical protein